MNLAFPAAKEKRGRERLSNEVSCFAASILRRRDSEGSEEEAFSGSFFVPLSDGLPSSSSLLPPPHIDFHFPFAKGGTPDMKGNGNGKPTFLVGSQYKSKIKFGR